MNNILIISFISLHKPSSLDFSSFPALFSFFVFCPNSRISIYLSIKRKPLQHKIATDFSILTDTLFQTDIAFQKGSHGNLSGGIVNPVIKLSLYLLFFLPKFLQIGRIDGLLFSMNIRAAVLINQVFSLALASLHQLFSRSIFCCAASPDWKSLPVSKVYDKPLSLYILFLTFGD